MKKVPAPAWLLLVSVVLAIGLHAGEAGAAIKVVASIFPVGDLVRRVAGSEAEVLVLLQPGASPHTFEPSPRAIQEVSESRVFFMVGAGLESWAGKLVAAAGPKNLAVVDLSQGLPLITDLDPDAREHRPAGDESGHEGGVNPHYWSDPLLALAAVDRIEAALAIAVPAGASGFAARAADLRSQLRGLDAEIRAAVAGFRSRRLVTFHNSWPYFARRYGLEIAGVIEVAPGREPSPRHLAQIVSRIRSLKVPAVFAEPQIPGRAAEVIALEGGVPVLLLDPVGGVAPDRMSYLDLMRFNLRALAAGLR